MISQIGYFVNSFFSVLRLGGDYDLSAFLSNLLQDLIQSLVKEIALLYKQLYCKACPKIIKCEKLRKILFLIISQVN